MSPIFWLIIIVLILILILVGWLLLRNTQTTTEKRKLNQTCSKTSDCNTGLVCDKTDGTIGVCKVSNGGVCSADSDCSSDSTCQDGICVAGSGVDKPCPCGEGLTCVNNVCKVAIGETCNSDEECASGMCQCNVCVVTDPHSVHVSKKMINELVSMLECGKCKKESRSCECSESSSHSIPTKSDSSKYDSDSSYPNRKRYSVSSNSTSSELSSSSEYSYDSNKSHKSGCKYLTSGSSTDCSCDKSSFTVSEN
jgi:hypothetical protein